MPTVLVVDDEPDICAMLDVYLTLELFNVLTACNGREALRCLHDQDAALILLDLMMPVMDGVEFRRQQQREPRLHAIPVLCMSARYDARQTATQLGLAGCLVKPIDLDTVIAAVRSFCAQSGG
jgi:DNA-binding response OmpR family regulator